MPLYDYQCRNCGHRAEVIHGVNDSGPTACERCGGPMRKLLTVPSIVFKGSGWAKKDARDARPTAKSGTSGKDSTDAGKAGESASKGESATPAKSGESAGSSAKEGSSTSGAAAD